MTTTNCVYDTSALVAVLRNEPGADKVQRHLIVGDGCMHAVNMGEFLYTISRRLPERFTPESASIWLETSAIRPSEIITRTFLVLTARIRRASPALSFGDGVAVALAASLGVPVLTTEKAFAKASEFARVELIR